MALTDDDLSGAWNVGHNTVVNKVGDRKQGKKRNKQQNCQPNVSYELVSIETLHIAFYAIIATNTPTIMSEHHHDCNLPGHSHDGHNGGGHGHDHHHQLTHEQEEAEERKALGR